MANDLTNERRATAPVGLVLGSEIVVRTAIIVAGVLAVLWVLLELRVVTVPLFVALLFTTVLQVPVRALRRRGWPPLLATWAVLLGSIAIVAGGIAALVPSFLDQTGELGERIDEGIAEIEQWLETGPLGIENPDLRAAVDTAVDRLLQAEPGALVDGVTIAAEVLAGALLALVMVFFFVKDGPRLTEWAGTQIPDSRREVARRSASAAWAALAAYVRGTLVVGIVNGAIIGIGLAVLGVPLALPLAIITALSAFFPLVGAVVAGTLAALVALVTGGVVQALIVVALTVAVQQIEGDVLSPIVMGKALKLHPLVILISLTVGAVTAGILGAFLAVPLTGVVVAAVAAARRPVAGADPPIAADGVA
jgi:predicted PurR-regulated permease PerM